MNDKYRINSKFVYIGIKRNDNLLDRMFKDIYGVDGVDVIPSMFPFSADIIDLIGDGSTRFFDNACFQFFMYIFQRLFNPFRRIKKTEKKIYFLFTNFSARGMSILYIKYLLKIYPNAVPVMLFLDQKDIYSAKYALKLVKAIPEFLCYTFDPDDADKLGFKYTMCVYSNPGVEAKNGDCDLYFSFFGPGRLARVAQIGKKIRESGGKTKIIYIGNYPENISENLKSEIINIKKRITYDEVLESASRANCLLEFTRDTQTGVTIRYYEALCLNKKLLTNNKNVVNLPFYDERFIKVFSDIDDIDPEWVCGHEKVDYHYDGRFSPLLFLKEIEENA